MTRPVTRGRVYTWSADASRPLHDRARAEVVELPNLEQAERGAMKLMGRFVVVHNACILNVPDGAGHRPLPLGDASPDAEGQFLFVPGRGGGRVDKTPLCEPEFRSRYVQASRFGEVNAYFHVDRIASYVDELLRSVSAPSLPRVTVLVNAHHAATALDADGARDGLRRDHGWVPFQGGHYRLSAKATNPRELSPVAPSGEIHLGPGRGLVEHGALPAMAGGRYRANASHNPGIVYHEYGHHITRHTADLSCNGTRHPERQDNRKTALDEGTSDYWAAALLETPHIWAFHQRSEEGSAHSRSLTSPKTMRDYDPDRRADAHDNGTIWAAALWDLRTEIARTEAGGARVADRLVLGCLRTLGRIHADEGHRGPTRRLRARFETAAAALLEADALLSEGRHESVIRSVLRRRGIAVGKVVAAGPAAGQDRTVSAHE